MSEEFKATIKEIGGTILELRRSKDWQWAEFATSILYLLRWFIDRDPNSEKLRETAIRFLTEGTGNEKRNSKAGFYV